MTCRTGGYRATIPVMRKLLKLSALLVVYALAASLATAQEKQGDAAAAGGLSGT